ncbi:hypothetical protein PAMA_006596 [Pampus argenteus]
MQLCHLLCSLLLALMMLSSGPALVNKCSDFGQSICGAQAPGDIMIGIMLPCHRKVKNLNDRVRPENFQCLNFDLMPFMKSLAIIHEIEEINAAGFLPGVRLGYMLCDTCSYASKALQSVEHMLAVNNSLNIQCDYTNFRPKVKIILGALYSEVSIAVARLLNVYMVPLLSSASSTPELSDKMRFPVFMRTIPSDKHQTKAVAKMMHHFGWTWVGVVYADDNYGKAAFQSFLKDAGKNGVCLAYQEVLPHYSDHEYSMQRIKQVSQQIRSSNAQVVLLILKAEIVELLFKEIIRTNTSRTWISSDAWSRSTSLAHMDGINKVGDILGFTFVAVRSESFDNSLKNLTVTPGGYNYFIDEYNNLRFNCSPECFSTNPPSYCSTPELLKMKSKNACNFADYQAQNDDFLIRALDTSESFTDRVAVWAVANALKTLMKCNSSLCSGEINFPPWKLLEELKTVKFVFDNQTYFFDKNGDFVNGYDLIMWDKDGHHRRFKRIGRYHALAEQIELDVKNFIWLSTANTTMTHRRLHKLYKPPVIIIVITTLQGIICLFWLVFDSPDIDNTPPSPQSMKKVLQCSEVYITNTEERTSVQASAILVSSYGIVFCHFLPKCYEALWGSKTDTLEQILRRGFSRKNPAPNPDQETQKYIFSLLNVKMGCSPSKGKLCSKPEGPGPQKALLAEASQDSVDSRPVEEAKTDGEENEFPISTADHSTKSQEASDTKDAQSAEDVKETEMNVISQETVTEVVQTDTVIKTEKRKKNKDKRRSMEKQRKSSIIQTKVDFPPHMVRAHQAAYAFLNPNISKYETLLGLLDQAAQTQLSLQPMMSALVLRFEEINQALEEMAEEGELMLKEHGDYLALPSGMMGPVVMPAKPSTDTTHSPDPPPDLLQQLLQHSTEKIKLVGSSAQALGDTTLEEAVEYFSSLSKLLVMKLQAKQAAEQRLTKVLARVEGAAMRKSNPEDCALHSEDSGIGGENESLTGSERRHRGSAGSGSYPSQPLIYMRAKYMQDLQPSVKRPLTAVTATKSEPSTKCVNIVMELQKSKRDLDQRMKKMSETRGNKELAGPHYNLYRGGLRRHSVSSSAGAQKGTFKTNKSPQPPKHQSVRKLINTFSQGVDGRPGQSLVNIPPHMRRPRKSGILLLSDIGNSNERGLVINGNNNNNSWPDSRDDLDVDNLPPPPPEVLMDNSFQSTEGMQENEGSQDETVQSLPMINQKMGVSQRLRASVQNVEVLPNRVRMRSRPISMSPARPVRQDAAVGEQDAEQQPETDLDPEMRKANCLYQQACKIIHLRNAAESSDKRNIAEQSSRGPSPLQARMGHRFESNELYEVEMSSCSLPVIAPPVSRVRLPPSCPSVRHRFPSPPVFRPQSTSRPSSRPSSPRTVTRATENNTEEIIPSVSFRDARSVFCQKESQNPQMWTPSGSSVLPRPWGEASRGRLPTRGTDKTTLHFTQPEQRPSLTSHPELSKDGNSTSTQAKQTEPVDTKQRLVSPPMTEDNTQLDPSATAMTA